MLIIITTSNFKLKEIKVIKKTKQQLFKYSQYNLRMEISSLWRWNNTQPIYVELVEV